MESVRLRAVKTFHSSNYGRINSGEIFWSEPGYGKEMIALGNAKLERLDDELHQPRVAPIIEPDNAPALSEAPQGKDPATESQPDPLPENTSGDLSENGPARPSSASPRGRRSRRKT